MSLPAPVRLSAAVLGPLVPATDPARVAVQADTGAFRLEHLRADTLAGVADALEVVAVPPGPVAAGPACPVLYGGPYFDHFGHMAAEGIHRLWAASIDPALRGVPVAFQVPASGQPVRPWFGDVLELCGVAAERLLPVDRPTRFETLVVPRQGRVLGGVTIIPGYERLFPLVELEAGARSGARLYLSRSRQRHAGSYLGESLVESLLQDAGFEIVHPDVPGTRALVEQLHGASAIVFAEGSAIHNLELCGPVSAPVFVVGRRHGTRRRFERLLSSICRSWFIHPAQSDDLGLDWDAGRGVARTARACGVVDIAALLRAMGSFFGIALPDPPAAAITRAVERDLLRFLIDPRSGGGNSDESLGRALRALRASATLKPLLEPDAGW